MYKFILIIYTVFIYVNAYSANFTNGKIDGVGYDISITGNINTGDALIFQNKINELKKEYEASEWKKKYKDWKFLLRVDLNSQGGNLAEAMKIGYIVREYESETFVSYKSECLSSCVFILAAGVNRNVIGKVGIHRPYFEALNSNATTLDIKKMRDENKKVMKEYFVNMDVSDSIIEEMMSIEPNKIKILSEDELTKFRLSVMDADHEEKMIAEDAQRYNLTSSVYRQRNAIALKKCGYFFNASRENRLPEFWKCENMTMLNITESEYLNREVKAKSTCFKMEQGMNRGRCLFDVRILGK